MALLSVQTVPRNDGVTMTETVAASTDEFPNVNGGTIGVIINDDASPVAITVTGVAEPKYGRAADRVYTVPATSIGIFGPLSKTGFNAADGNVNIAAASTTSLTYGLLEIDKSRRI